MAGRSACSKAKNGVGQGRNGGLSTAAQAYAITTQLRAVRPITRTMVPGGPPHGQATVEVRREVIAYGASSGQGFIDMWMNSGGHRNIILDGTYVDVGVGCYESAGQPILCVAMFGSTSY
jgi:hypothetical protein